MSKVIRIHLSEGDVRLRGCNVRATDRGLVLTSHVNVQIGGGRPGLADNCPLGQKATIRLRSLGQDFEYWLELAS